MEIQFPPTPHPPSPVPREKKGEKDEKTVTFLS